MSHLYIHIPFCQSKCHYCDFVSCNDPHAVEAYLHALVQELHLLNDAYPGPLQTIYIGGGTPSVLSQNHWQVLFEGLKASFGLTCQEFTVEVNPESLTSALLDLLHANGVNRISMGVQTLSDKLLKTLGRQAKAGQVIKALEAIKASQIDNFSVDVIYGIPGQTLEEIKDTLEVLLSYGPKHVSTYALKIEEGTRMSDHYQQGIFELPDEDEVADQFDLICQSLKDQAYDRYEISNFALKTYESKHNSAYWMGVNTLGAGVSAVYLRDQERITNRMNLPDYLEDLAKGRLPLEDVEHLSDRDVYNEYIMLRLRTKEGLDEVHLKEAFHVDFERDHTEWLTRFSGLGLVEKKGSRYRLTSKGMNIANQLIMPLLRM